MKRVIGEDHREISPTVGFNIKTLEFRDFILNLWDIGGQKTIRTYWRNYFEQTDGIIWVVDSVDRFRLEECRQQLRELLVQEVSTCCRCVLGDNSCVPPFINCFGLTFLFNVHRNWLVLLSLFLRISKIWVVHWTLKQSPPCLTLEMKIYPVAIIVCLHALPWKAVD